MIPILTPAYGRDYKSRKEVLAAINGPVDFNAHVGLAVRYATGEDLLNDGFGALRRAPQGSIIQSKGRHVGMKPGTTFKIEFVVTEDGFAKAVGGAGLPCRLPDSSEPVSILYKATPLDVTEPAFKLGDKVKGPGGEGVYITRLGGSEVYRVRGYEYRSDRIPALDCHSCRVGELEAA